ncbi:cytochrome P450 [Raineyella antarctica]|uniref:cytochrome P450 n=1 Tax=Raineyella antarctica TaxID=1577474 RepID=UPI000B83318B|nr:cytochrome P450 [Raineyella antarctica]
MSADAPDRRVSHRPGEASRPRVEHRGEVWHLRSTEAVRQVLRERDATTQAGFSAEQMPDSVGERPILFMDGEEHRRQRTKVARFFAPKTVANRYRELMEVRADALVAEALATTTFRLDQLSLRYSTEVAAQVIGLTNSNMEGMARRLERLFAQPDWSPDSGVKEGGLRGLWRMIRGHTPMLAFYLADVRPAIAARRKVAAEDVISHLLAEEYKAPAILIECVTYGAAGMATTREFISMAVLHLLADADLRARYLAAEEPERFEILHEILRLEPIIGHLYRRAARDIDLPVDGEMLHIRKGELIDLYVRQANSDESTVGDCPLDLRPGRPLPRGIGPEVMSFGDGQHKCPGNSLAIQETDILLSRLLRHDLVVAHAPIMEWDELTAGYSLREFVLTVPKPLPVAVGG